MNNSSIRDDHKPKVVVGTGWWSNGGRGPWAIGDTATRSPAFFDLWRRQIHRCLRPDRIVVTDRASRALQLLRTRLPPEGESRTPMAGIVGRR
jgi:hypothetical protein